MALGQQFNGTYHLIGDGTPAYHVADGLGNYRATTEHQEGAQGMLFSPHTGTGSRHDPLEKDYKDTAQTAFRVDQYSKDPFGPFQFRQRRNAQAAAVDANIPAHVLRELPTYLRGFTQKKEGSPAHYAGDRTIAMRKDILVKGGLDAFRGKVFAHEMGHHATGPLLSTIGRAPKGPQPVLEGVAEGFTDRHNRGKTKMSDWVSGVNGVSESRAETLSPAEGGYSIKSWEDPSDQAAFLAARLHSSSLDSPHKDPMFSPVTDHERDSAVSSHGQSVSDNVHILGRLYHGSSAVRELFSKHYSGLESVAKEAADIHRASLPKPKPKQFEDTQIPGVDWGGI